jgi:TusA-related sulfurtransferase
MHAGNALFALGRELLGELSKRIHFGIRAGVCHCDTLATMGGAWPNSWSTLLAMRALRRQTSRDSLFLMKAQRLDMRGRACPAPIVELMRAMRALAEGESLEVIADDRAFPADVSAWCKKTSNTLISLDKRPEGHVAIVKKGAGG